MGSLLPDNSGVRFHYEPKRITLSTGVWYLPDFFIEDFAAYFEVKPANDAIVTEECVKARQLAADLNGQRVWLAMGAPNAAQANILPLEEWSLDHDIAEILATPENRYYFLEDRRDERIYWLQADYVTGTFRHSFAVGGPGTNTDHDRLPLLHRTVKEAYDAAKEVRF